MTSLRFSDERIQYLTNVMQGIRQIKVRCLQQFFVTKIEGKRRSELGAYGKYCDIKNICSAIYFNSGVILSTLLFLLVDRSLLDLGKVFSTLSMLGYIFNFSVNFSNLAIEALNAIQVFQDRIDEAITKPFEES